MRYVSVHISWRWLIADGKSIAAFVKEAGLPADSRAGALTVEQIVREKQLFDLSLNFEKSTLMKGIQVGRLQVFTHKSAQTQFVSTDNEKHPPYPSSYPCREQPIFFRHHVKHFVVKI